MIENKAQFAENLLVFKALQRSSSLNFTLSLKDAVKHFKISVIAFDHSDTMLYKRFLTFDVFNERKNRLLIESRP